MNKQIGYDFIENGNKVKVVSISNLIYMLKRFEVGDYLYLYLDVDVDKAEANSFISIRLVEWEETTTFMIGGFMFEVHAVNKELMNCDWGEFSRRIDEALKYLGVSNDKVGIILNDTFYSNFVNGLFFIV